MGQGDESLLIKDVAPLQDAAKGTISFLDNVRYKDDLTQTKASACIVHEKMKHLVPEDCVALLSDHPYKSYALIAQIFYPEEKRGDESISETASIHQTASIGKNCEIGAFAVIGPGAKIGDHCRIAPQAVIGKNVEIGNNSYVGAHASLSHCLIGCDVKIYNGARIGQDGFGFAISLPKHTKVPQLGRVIIGDHVEIGANTTIDRGAGPDTVIGEGTWIDNLVQIGHNVQIGKGCIIVAQAGIAGSTVMEDYAVLAAQGGIAGHLTIGTGAKIAAQSGVMHNIEAGAEMMGSPAQPIKQHLRQVAFLKKAVKK